MLSLTLYIFSLVMFSRSLDVIFFSTASTIPSLPRIPTQIPAWEIASIAYSTWRCVWGVWCLGWRGMLLHNEYVQCAKSFSCRMWGCWLLQVSNAKQKGHGNLATAGEYLIKPSFWRKGCCTWIISSRLSRDVNACHDRYKVLLSVLRTQVSYINWHGAEEEKRSRKMKENPLQQQMKVRYMWRCAHRRELRIWETHQTC